MMKFEDVNSIENGLKALLDDEEKGIAEYEQQIKDATRWGAVTTARELQKIKQQESAHADTLRVLIGRAEFAKFGMLPGQETGAVMEQTQRGVVRESRWSGLTESQKETYNNNVKMLHKIQQLFFNMGYSLSYKIEEIEKG